ncbi:Uma2 family endonuclease [Planktothrix mougeotii]|uniref:Uma2 family endonuclease n=1 Tax=Planktothrix mougeotii LEGE 06226 TaxID=1828728 RepID=A0ABR9UJ68_9CYAN|nr:Uma2 family endonuclease [Planktothrix mougeotii]MBE9145861.1 Uma2 family endonuclease [Planktothrix mougeotii LEGE 06226]
MTQTLLESESEAQLMTLEEFLDWVPDGFPRYELHRGVVKEMQPTGTHEQIASFLTLKLGIQIESLGVPYFIARQCIIKPIDSDKSGFNPDLMIINKNYLDQEPMWKKRSTITQGKTLPLVVEVVSTNWQDDYLLKLSEYEKLGIQEYWIIDYLGLGGRRYIGNPKQPTISVYQMIDGEYMVNLFRENDRIQSVIFPELNLTPTQIFQGGEL